MQVENVAAILLAGGVGKRMEADMWVKAFGILVSRSRETIIAFPPRRLALATSCKLDGR